MKTKFDVKMRQNFKGASKTTINDVGSALYMIGEEIMTDAKANYVPVITGNLRRSGFVNMPVVTAQRVSITLGFGGAAKSYALQVHEAPDYFGQGKNKYLSKPVNAALPRVSSKLTKYIQARLTRRGFI